MTQVIERLGKSDALDGHLRCDELLQQPVLECAGNCSPQLQPAWPENAAHRLLFHAESGIAALDQSSRCEDLRVTFPEVPQEDECRAPRVKESRMLIGRQCPGTPLPLSHGGPECPLEELPPGQRHPVLGCTAEDSLLHAPATLIRRTAHIPMHIPARICGRLRIWLQRSVLQASPKGYLPPDRCCMK